MRMLTFDQKSIMKFWKVVKYIIMTEIIFERKNNEIENKKLERGLN